MTPDVIDRPARYRPGSLSAWPVLILILLFAGACHAEGAVRYLDCIADKICDSAGTCTTNADQVLFRMEPVARDADGAGTYTISYGKTKVEMRALTNAGPFYWVVDDERDTLLASSETKFLWHRLTLSPSPETTVRFLTCSLSQ